MNIAKAFKIKLDNDKLFKGYTGEMKSEYFPDFRATSLERADEYRVSENIQSLTTIECILRNRGRKIIALNFANALYAGGAYVLGADAQEESLCRASLLYYTIRGAKRFYRTNRLRCSTFYTDGMILSERVPVIRNDSGELLSESFTVDFVTCPAVNRSFTLPWLKSRVNGIMERRIEKIVSFMQSREPEVMVLGAFGCGAFGNRRKDVLPLFERAINKYTDGSAEIIFAIPD